MNFDIPKMMKAVFLKDENGSFIVREVPVPTPGPGEVLVKISAAPINPSDIARIKSMLNTPEAHSFIPGIEGSGMAVAHGSGLLPKIWTGKRIACSSTHTTSGTWAEYMVTSAAQCFPISERISYEQGAMLLVNPMTAVAFFDIIKQNKHKAIINTAAAGALGKIINLLGEKYSIPVINIVRNDRQVNVLKLQGAKYVLSSGDPGFEEHLRSLSNEIGATLALDAVGGDLTQKILGAIPYKSTLIIYGNLSGSEQGVLLRSLLTEHKTITGFYLANWINDNGFIKTLRNLLRVKKLLKDEVEIKIQGKFPLEKVQQAIDQYLNNMTEGKVLLIPE